MIKQGKSIDNPIITKAPAVGCSENFMICPRFKREEHQRTNHDSAFSRWKVLIGPSDWEEHSLGKEGADRYRVHNLPKNCSCPGLYEFGIAGAPTGPTKLDPNEIVVTYVGRADNIRTRLQQYGRLGSHLENASGLFRSIFSRGYSIVFRWAPMRDKKDAEDTESKLLCRYDYAWNKGSNGLRRAGDVLEKLGNLSSSSTWLPKFARRLQNLNHKQAIKLLSPDNGFSMCTDKNGNNPLAQIFKFGRSQPRLVSDTVCLNAENSSICGVALGDDSFCERPPIKGRKRCAEHKGMKISRSNSKLIAQGKTNLQSIGSDIVSGKDACSCHYKHINYVTANLPPNKDKCANNKTSTHISGVAIDNGSSCKGPQVESKPIEEEFNVICGVTLGEGLVCERWPVKGRMRCEEHKGMRVKDHLVDDFGGFKPMIEESNVVMCRANLGRGFICKRPPVKGRKRCEEHKGMRMNAYTASRGSGSGTAAKEEFSYMCGATTANGSLCFNRPTEGNKRCWVHKGRRADSSFTGFNTGTSLFICGDSSFTGFNAGTSSFVCGVPLRNLSTCSRKPAHGRKRCEQHKGMRVTSSY